MNSIWCMLKLSPHTQLQSPVRDLVYSSTSLLLKYSLKNYFPFKIFLPGPASRPPPPRPLQCLSDFAPLLTWRECSAGPETSHNWLSLFHRKVSLEQGELHFRVLSLLPPSLLNTGWQIDLTFDCKVRVATCFLTFCLECGSFQNERSILPKWHFNPKWLWNECELYSFVENPLTSCCVQ